jgi:hypothetical protein
VPLSGIEDWRTLAPIESRYAGPDWLTGGMFGPESSLLVIATTAVAVVLLFGVVRRRETWRARPAENPILTQAPAGLVSGCGHRPARRAQRTEAPNHC